MPQIKSSNPIPRYVKNSLIFIFNSIRLGNILKSVRFWKYRQIHSYTNIQKAASCVGAST
jgi:hypothetical protein